MGEEKDPWPPDEETDLDDDDTDEGDDIDEEETDEGGEE